MRAKGSRKSRSDPGSDSNKQLAPNTNNRQDLLSILCYELQFRFPKFWRAVSSSLLQQRSSDNKVAFSFWPNTSQTYILKILLLLLLTNQEVLILNILLSLCERAMVHLFVGATAAGVLPLQMRWYNTIADHTSPYIIFTVMPDGSTKRVGVDRCYWVDQSGDSIWMKPF